MAIITVVADGNLYQTTPNARLNIHKYRSSISLDQDGLSSITKILIPGASIILSDIENFVHVYCTDVLDVVFVTHNTVTNTDQIQNNKITALFMATSKYKSVTLTNNTATKISVRAFYS